MRNNLEFDSNNNSIATILRKNKLSNNLYQFTFDKVIIGHMDKEKEAFISSDGKEYFSIKSPKILNYKTDRVFGTYLEIDDLVTIFSAGESVTSSYLIDRYIDYVKQLMYFAKVNRMSNGKYNINIKDIDLAKVEDSFKNYSSDDIISNDDTFVEEVLFDNKKNDDFLDEDFLDNSTISDDINNLIANVYNCEYNTSQLFTIGEHLCYLIDYIESAIDTIELQLQAYYDCDKVPLHPDDADFEFINSPKDTHKFINVDFKNKKVIDLKEKENKLVNKKMDLVELKDRIKKHLFNQDDALRRVLTEIARMDIKDNEKNKGILLLGDSGTGKTFLMELIAENINVPFQLIDSTQLTIPGYVGKDIEEYLWDLYEKCGKDLEKTENAIIFFDEIDKKGSNRKNDVSGQGVLNVLLKFLDGTTYDACRDTKTSTEKVRINTKKMKVIAAGAFSDVFHNEEDRKKKEEEQKSKKYNIGFAPYESEENRRIREEKEEKERKQKEEEENRKIPDVDAFVQKAFMTPEFMGRFPIRIRLNPHTVDSFSDILVNSQSSTLKEEERTFEKLNVKLIASPEFIKLASTEALKLKTGVRGLMGCIEEATWMAFEDVYNNPGKYEKIILTEENVHDPSKYEKFEKKNLNYKNY